MQDKERIVDVVVGAMKVAPTDTVVLYRSTAAMTKDEVLTQCEVFMTDLNASRVDMANAGRMRQEHPSELASRYFAVSWRHGGNYKGPRLMPFGEKDLINN